MQRCHCLFQEFGTCARGGYQDPILNTPLFLLLPYVNTFTLQISSFALRLGSFGFRFLLNVSQTKAFSNVFFKIVLYFKKAMFENITTCCFGLLLNKSVNMLELVLGRLSAQNLLLNIRVLTKRKCSLKRVPIHFPFCTLYTEHTSPPQLWFT